MSTLLLGPHRPGRTVLHRTPAGAKLLALVVVSLVLAVVRSWQLAVVTLVVALALAVLARTPLRELGRSLRGLVLVAVLLGGWLGVQSGWPRAVETVGDLLALVVLAGVLTTTTPVDAMLDTLVRVLRPLRPLGVDAERVALACSLVLRAVPATVDLARETRDAALARGLERDLRARLTPFVVRVVADAHATGEALHARGIGDD